MTNGLGASFGALLLLAILAGLAFVLTLAVVAASLFQRRTGPVPQWFYYLAAVITGTALLVAGFAVIALSDEAVTLAVVFAALVLAPLGIC